MLIGRYRVPQPRVALAQVVRDHASAAMDVSDGLAGDLAKLCGASGVSAVIDVATDSAVGAGAATWCRAAPSDVETLVAGGDDYEILCTVPQDRVEAFAQAARQAAGVAGELASARSSRAGAAPKFIDAAGQGNRAGTAVLQPFLRLAPLPPGPLFPAGHCYFAENL